VRRSSLLCRFDAQDAPLIHTLAAAVFAVPGVTTLLHMDFWLLP
jgi:hypothetical protein